MGRLGKFLGRAARGAGVGFLAGGPWGAVVGAGANAFIPGLNREGANLIGDITEPFTGNRQRRAALRAAKMQEALGRESLDFQKMMYEQGRQDLAPWREAGQGALSQPLSGLESGRFDYKGDQYVNPEFNYSFEADPGYQFRLAQGEKAISRGPSRFGGRMAKDLLRFNQGLASDEYNQAYGRARGAFERDRAFGRDIYERNRAFGSGQLSDLYNRYAGIAGLGQTTSSQGAQLGQQFGAMYGAGLEGIGNVRAAGIMGAENARSNASQNLLNLLISSSMNYSGGGR